MGNPPWALHFFFSLGWVTPFFFVGIGKFFSPSLGWAKLFPFLAKGNTFPLLLRWVTFFTLGQREATNSKSAPCSNSSSNSTDDSQAGVGACPTYAGQRQLFRPTNARLVTHSRDANDLTLITIFLFL